MLASSPLPMVSVITSSRKKGSNNCCWRLVVIPGTLKEQQAYKYELCAHRHLQVRQQRCCGLEPAGQVASKELEMPQLGVGRQRQRVQRLCSRPAPAAAGCCSSTCLSGWRRHVDQHVSASANSAGAGAARLSAQGRGLSYHEQAAGPAAQTQACCRCSYLRVVACSCRGRAGVRTCMLLLLRRQRSGLQAMLAHMGLAC